MKKLLPIIGMYVGSFIALNVGMYFLLMFMQPEPVAQLDEMAADSTLTHEETAIPDEDAEFDHAPDEEQMTHETTGDSLALPNAVQSTEHDEQHGGEVQQLETTQPNVAQTEGAGVQDDGAQDAETESVDPVVALSDTPKSTAEIAKLAKVLEGMKPAEAAVIAERLPTETIVELVMRMKSRSGAKMMASLPVPVAASVATRMAELSGTRKPS